MKLPHVYSRSGAACEAARLFKVDVGFSPDSPWKLSSLSSIIRFLDLLDYFLNITRSDMLAAIAEIVEIPSLDKAYYLTDS